MDMMGLTEEHADAVGDAHKTADAALQLEQGKDRCGQRLHHLERGTVRNCPRILCTCGEGIHHQKRIWPLSQGLR